MVCLFILWTRSAVAEIETAEPLAVPGKVEKCVFPAKKRCHPSKFITGVLTLGPFFLTIIKILNDH